MSMFTAVEMAPRDPILGLNEQFNADSNPNAQPFKHPCSFPVAHCKKCEEDHYVC